MKRYLENIIGVICMVMLLSPLLIFAKDISHTDAVPGQLRATDKVPLGRYSTGRLDGKGIAYTATVEQIGQAVQTRLSSSLYLKLDKSLQSQYSANRAAEKTAQDITIAEKFLASNVGTIITGRFCTGTSSSVFKCTTTVTIPAVTYAAITGQPADNAALKAIFDAATSAHTKALASQPAFGSGAQNRVVATPDGSSGNVGIRALVANDIPSLSSLYATVASTNYPIYTQYSTAVCNGSLSIDPANGKFQRVSVGGTCRVLVGLAASGKVMEGFYRLKQPVRGHQAVTMQYSSASTKKHNLEWAYGSVPTFTQTTSATDIVAVKIYSDTIKANASQDMR